MADINVIILTYNHEKYISECLDSILSQQTKYTFKIIVGDDASTDRTPQILQTYKAKHPDKIELLLHSENLGPSYLPGLNNFLSVLHAVNARFVSLIEGDDYLISTDKLEIQASYLDDHPEASGCFHNAILVDQTKELIRENYYEVPKSRYTQAECISELRSAYATSAVFFRSECIKDMPSWFTQWTSDYALDILITEYGELHHINKPMSAYRVHSKGIWSGTPAAKNREQLVHRLKLLYKEPSLRKKHGENLRRELEAFMRETAWLYHKEGDKKNARKAYWKYLKFKRPLSSAEVKLFFKKFLF